MHWTAEQLGTFDGDKDVEGCKVGKDEGARLSSNVGELDGVDVGKAEGDKDIEG